MISVVIPYSEDQTYLVRCINAIKRQTYKDVELFLIAEQQALEMARQQDLEVTGIENSSGKRYDGINEAIRMARGEYLFFCSITSVPAPNTLEILEKNYETDGRIWTYGNCYEEKGQGFEACSDMAASLFGKLYHLRVIRDNNIRFRKDSPFAEMQFVAEYAAHMGNMALSEKIYIYETDRLWNQLTYVDEDIVQADWEALLRGLNGVNGAAAGQLLDILCRRLEKYPVFSPELLEITQEVSNSASLQYAVAKSVLKFWWTEVTERQDKQAFENLKTCLAGYEEDEAYLELLLLACGLQKDQYTYFKDQDLWTLLYFIRESSELKGYGIQALKPAGDEEKTKEQQIHRVAGGLRTGLVKTGSDWYYYRNDEIDWDYIGLAKNQFGWYYVKNGTLDLSYDGIVRNRHGAWCVEKGIINRNAKGYRRVGEQEAFFTDGRVDENQNGFIRSNGVWRYYDKGRVDEQFTGMVKNEHGWWYVEKGEINYDFEGLAENEYGWWYIKNGTIDYSFKGYARNSEGWHYVENGTIREETPDLEAGRNITGTWNEASQIQESKLSVQTQVEVTGSELAEYTVSKYAGGELGLRTILESLGAWLKCKFGS